MEANTAVKVEEYFPPLPEAFKPELLRRMTIRETLIVAAQYGLVQVAERIGYDEFVRMSREVQAQ